MIGENCNIGGGSHYQEGRKILIRNSKSTTAIMSHSQVFLRKTNDQEDERDQSKAIMNCLLKFWL